MCVCCGAGVQDRKSAGRAAPGANSNRLGNVSGTKQCSPDNSLCSSQQPEQQKPLQTEDSERERATDKSACVGRADVYVCCVVVLLCCSMFRD